MDSIESPIVVENDRARKRKRNDANSRRSLLKLDRYGYYKIGF